MEKAKKPLLILLVILLSIISVLFLSWSALHAAKYLLYPDYYKNRETISKIPALNDGFVPQGIWYDEQSGSYLHSGYCDDYAQVYVVNSDGDVKQLTPLYRDGQPGKGHGGAIVRAGNYVYLFDEGETKSANGILYQFRYEDIMNAADGASVTPISTFTTHCGMSFAFVDQNYIYVGEFYRDGTDYITPDDHHFTTPEGDENKSLMYAYPLNEDGSIASQTPSLAVSIPSEAQGFAIQNGAYVVSRSWGMNLSCLEIYSGWTDAARTVTVNDTEIPLYYLGSKTLTQTVQLPRFNENLTLIGEDRIATTFESASNKYIVGKLFFAFNVISYPVSGPKS